MLTSDLNLSKNCKRIEILKCVLKNVHYYYYYYYSAQQYLAKDAENIHLGEYHHTISSK